MIIAPEIQIDSTIRKGSVFYFVEESFNSPHPHYFIILNNKPSIDTITYLCCVVTFDLKVYERIDWMMINQKIPEECFVNISEKDCDFLKHSSMVDCNAVIEKSKQILVEKLQNKKLKMLDPINSKIIEKINNGIKLSKLVSNKIKRKLGL